MQKIFKISFIFLFSLILTSCKDLNKPEEVFATLQNGYWEEVECYEIYRLKSGKLNISENLLKKGMDGGGSCFLRFREGNRMRYYWSMSSIPDQFYLDSPYYYNEQDHCIYNELKDHNIFPKVKILELSDLFLTLQTEDFFINEQYSFYKRRFKRIRKADFLESFRKKEEKESPSL